MGTVNIEWDKIDMVTSVSTFEVELDGSEPTSAAAGHQPSGDIPAERRQPCEQRITWTPARRTVTDTVPPSESAVTAWRARSRLWRSTSSWV